MPIEVHMRCLTSKEPEPDLPPAIVAEIASILAAGYLEYRRSLRVSEADNCLDSGATESVHVPAVNASGEGEN
jgi:hypothetical protein